MSLHFSYGKLSFEEVREFLLETDNEFPTPLSQHVEIETYAMKLAMYSDFSLCFSDNQLVGMISCYTNRPPKGFISNVCVKKDFQGKGLFSVLFMNLIGEVKKKRIEVICLEVDVNNSRAMDVYSHVGFSVAKGIASTNKCLLEYYL